MHNFITFIKEFRIPKKKELENAITSFSKNKLFIFTTITIVAFITMIILLQKINNSFMVTIPINGGTVTEGIIGIPTLVNPVLALSDADKDLTALVYSGLMRKMPDGTFIPDIAESYTVSPDGMTYTFIIKNNITFHDGKLITADDIVFTINKIKDPLIKSPRQIGWDGISVNKKDPNTVVFTLKKPYISFMDNTTIGILPMHIWNNINGTDFSLSPLNIKAIGSGPYKIDSVIKNNDGIPEIYNLKQFENFTLGSPHIKNINIKSFSNEKDLIKSLLNNSIDQAGGLSSKNANTIKNAGYIIHTATLPRMFGLFFNSMNNQIFNDPVVINAFNKTIDKEEIINQVLNGYGTAIQSPVPTTIISDALNKNYNNTSLDEARNILEKGGWIIGPDGIRIHGGTKTITQKKKVGKKIINQKVTINNGPTTKLSFSLSTGNTPELEQTSNIIKEQLEKIGAQVNIKIYETGQLNQLIVERSYEALFFGQIINHESDLLSFWHSSQRKDPGLNIAMYSNKTIDSILESIQKTLNYNNRIDKYKNLIQEFNKDTPALLIYSPKYLYAISPEINNVSIKTLTIPSDRFQSIYTWYANKDHVWKIFTNLPTININK